MIERGTTLLALTTLMLAIGGFDGPAHADAQDTASAAAETLFVYGPGGPLPAMKELGADFGRLHGIDVVVTGGPTPQWLSMARANADVIFSGAENMMTDFVKQLADTGKAAGDSAAPAGRIDEASIYRDAGVALTVKGREREHARQFAAYLESPAGARVFAKWGWMTGASRTRAGAGHASR